MGSVHCPFCGGSVHVAGDGSVEPRCPRCGAWAVAAGTGAGLRGATAASTALGATQALEERAVAGPSGEVRFIRAPYAGEVPEGLDL